MIGFVYHHQIWFVHHHHHLFWIWFDSSKRNYLEVYRFESWGGSLILNYTFGQQFSGTTRPPPPLLSESDLLDCMDKAGIGTDATMHDHIKKLTDRFYATKEGSHFKPTNLGEALVMGYDDMGYELWKPYLRNMMEEDMKAVSVGNKRRADVLSTCLQQMACFLDARVNKVKLLQALEIFFDRPPSIPNGICSQNHDGNSNSSFQHSTFEETTTNSTTLNTINLKLFHGRCG